MNIARTLVLGSLLLVAIVCVFPWAMLAEPAVKEGEKPAAVIDASKYPSLQAAFDAVPLT